MKTKLLEKLCRAPGISGHEGEVRKIMKKEFQKTCQVEEYSFVNLIARKGKKKGKRIMLAAHMDEVGLMVKHINEEGFLSFIKMGSIDDRNLLNQRVIIKSEKGNHLGIIGSKPPHLQKKEEKEKVIKHDELFIDLGAKDKKDAQKKVSVGDPIIFQANFGKLNKNLFYGKAIDDRVGCYILLKVMENLPKTLPLEIYAVGTAQEEVGLKGARVSAFKLNPDYAFAIDTTISGDIPQIKDTESNLKLGKGPAITIAEASGKGVITHPKLRKLLLKIAQKHKVPYQEDLLEGGMTDGAIIYLTREGVPTGVLSVPTRYLHTSAGIFSMKDVNNTIKLLTKTLSEFKV